ncbi:putative Cysteine/Histidine-rich C1 domain family protein [Quillaja saponaria]|uniref:Cysteine/Histidine-rich C1 domain family protein n=1 Tax=Quillaja saponaria TaxID=32244 RepID=A0AAD7PY16_QUISA|nr:putative Cysteine/Histidine-rich C1 domain family protein [Quillaja saponaria]
MCKCSSLLFPFIFEDRHFNFHLNVPGSRPRICDGCGKDVLGFVYQCSHGKYDFHPCCLKLPRTIPLSVEDDAETLYLSKKVRKKCQKCKSKYSSEGFKGWSYASSDDKYCYHVACVKEIILENWRRGYFNEATAYEIQPHNHGFQSLFVVPSREMVVPGRGRSFGKKVNKLAKVVFKLIVSAIFGNPVSMIATLVEALATELIHMALYFKIQIYFFHCLLPLFIYLICYDNGLFCWFV